MKSMLLVSVECTAVHFLMDECSLLARKIFSAAKTKLITKPRYHLPFAAPLLRVVPSVANKVYYSRLQYYVRLQ
jgi:hypothetical protein